jgi:hypothetical protein
MIVKEARGNGYAVTSTSRLVKCSVPERQWDYQKILQ